MLVIAEQFFRCLSLVHLNTMVSRSEEVTVQSTVSEPLYVISTRRGFIDV